MFALENSINKQKLYFWPEKKYPSLFSVLIMCNPIHTEAQNISAFLIGVCGSNSPQRPSPLSANLTTGTVRL